MPSPEFDVITIHELGLFRNVSLINVGQNWWSRLPEYKPLDPHVQQFIISGFLFWFTCFFVLRLVFNFHPEYRSWSWQFKVVWQQKLVGLADCVVTFIGAFYTLFTQNLHLDPLNARSVLFEFFLCFYSGYLLYDFVIRLYYPPIRSHAFLCHHIFTLGLTMSVVFSRQGSYFGACMLTFLLGDALIFLRLIIGSIPVLKGSVVDTAVYYLEFVWYIVRIIFATYVNIHASAYGLYSVLLGGPVTEKTCTIFLAIPIALCLNFLTVLFVYWLIVKTKIVLLRWRKNKNSLVQTKIKCH
jgi:hypothetical protein